MTRLERLRRRIAIVLPAVVAMLLISTQSAHATSYQNLWKWTKKTYVITHKRVYENNGSTSVTISTSKTWTRTEHAEVTANIGMTGGMGAFMDKLGAEVGFSVAASGDHTYEHNISITITVPKYKQYVFYSGTKRIDGYQERWGCSSQRCAVVGHKQGHSFTVQIDGNYQCGSTPLSGLASKAKLLCN